MCLGTCGHITQDDTFAFWTDPYRVISNDAETAPMARNIIRKRAVQERTGLSDTTIWRLEKAGDFPARIQITDGGSVGWFADEVDRWVHERVRGAGKRPPRAGRDKAA
jgi:predicted DNA-binding transcriptional regulator AlpA